MAKKYIIWCYHRTYKAQSKTKVFEQLRREWSYTPSAVHIEIVAGKKLLDIIDLKGKVSFEIMGK